MDCRGRSALQWAGNLPGNQTNRQTHQPGSRHAQSHRFDHLDLVPGEQVLHLGCGTGYYSAIIAELVGSLGQVTAVEIDATLAQKARAALADWPQVKVIHADGARTSFEPVDAIVASAGATHPLSSWLDALRPGGRLLFPMTTLRNGPGAMLLVKRRTDDRFAARFLCRAGFIDFQGARDPAISRRLTAALRRDQGAAMKSLRRDNHREDATCWLHGGGWCLSCREADGQHCAG
jgi:protein-L-isoaspartate(D-aspartate) O-methyltransferase